MAIDRFKVQDREIREQAHADYIAHPGFAAAEKEASARGFRHATINEVHSSAEGRGVSSDLFSWRGGLWVKNQNQE